MSVGHWLTKLVKSKVDIALALADGASGASYDEAAIIISSVLTALAAELWPGLKQDRVRFIELLVQMATSTPSLETVSIPLLVQYLESEGRYQEAEALEPKRFLEGRSKVVTSSDVDLSISETLAIAPTLSIKLLRRFSYAAILYKELRSSYAHQYQAGENADYRPATKRSNQTISYTNRLCRTSSGILIERRIHFHIEWLAALALGVAQSIDTRFGKSRPLRPSAWWIDQDK